MTHFRTSVTALEPDSHTLRAAQLITRPGGLPTITIPMIGGRMPDVYGVWRYLQEAAEFFGIPMPPLTDLSTALAKCSGLGAVAVTVMISDVDGVPSILMSSLAVQPLCRDAVRIAGDESVPQVHDASDPWWRRMVARTTSRGELDQRERWLNGRGYADGLSGGRPLLGALLFETPDGVVGVENPEPTSVLDQLTRCGAIAPIGRVSAPPNDAQHVWWVSPRYETHPVVELDGMRFAVGQGGSADGGSDEAVPSFARWS